MNIMEIMDSFEGYKKVGVIKPIVGKKYYYFLEILEEGQKVKLTKPKIGNFVKEVRSSRDYMKLIFKVDDKEVDVYYGFEAGTMYLKEYEDISYSNFCMVC